MARFDSNVAIRIAADFVGLPAFKKADTAVDKLYKSTKKLGAAFGLTFSATAIARFGAQSVRAFANEERQVASLTATVKSLGLAFRANDANVFIEDLERLTGIAREQLQPAFQRLLTQTASITRSQQILTAAVKVSMSGLMSVEEAANALTQAYVGNTKGLKQFNLGLTNAELAAMSFDQVLTKVSKTYDNQFNAALDTTQVKLDKFNVAIGNAKENIGSGLVDAFAKFAGNGNIDTANSKIEQFSMSLADVIRNGNILAAAEFFVNPLALAARAAVGMGKTTTKGPNLGSPASWRTRNAQLTRERKIEQDAAARLAKIEATRLATLKKTTAEKKAQAALDKANALLLNAQEKFDLEGIQIQAALMNSGKLNTEELYRLSLKKAIYDLEQAIASEDQKRIATASAVLEKLNAQWSVLGHANSAAAALGGTMAAIGTDKSLVNIQNLNDALAILKQMLAIWLQMQGGVFGGTTGGPSAPKKKGPVLPPIFDSSGKITPRGEIVLPPTDESPMEKYLRALEEANATIAKNADALKPIVETGLFDMYYNAQEFIGAGINPYQMSDAAAKAYSQSQTPINVTVNGAIDPEGTARTIVDVLSRSYGRGALPNQLLIL